VREEDRCRRRSCSISYKRSYDDLAVEPPYYITSVRTFAEAGVPSEDRGLVVTMADGSEYQIMIVRSQ
jgi:hypothetical protein